MKKILILGGAKAQVPLIEAAKKEGYCVVLCDWTTTNPGITLANKHYQVSTLDISAVLEVARKEKVNGVISNSEPAMKNVAAVAQELGLTGSSVESVETLQSKCKFRQLQKRTGVFAPEFVNSENCEFFLEKLKALRYPIIIKPSKSSGSRGTTKVDSYDVEAIRRAFAECSEFSIDNRVVGEEFWEMSEGINIEADVFVFKDTFVWDGLFTNIRSQQHPMIPQTYVFPSILTEDQIDRFKRTVSVLLREAEFSFGEVNVEGYFTVTGELFIVEINVRQGGCSIPRWIFEHCGMDLYKLLVTTCMGDEHYWNEVCASQRTKRYITNYVLLPNKSGEYGGISIDEKLSPYVNEIKLHRNIGDPVRQARNATDSTGMISFVFPTREEQLFYSWRLSKYIEERVE